MCWRLRINHRFTASLLVQLSLVNKVDKKQQKPLLTGRKLHYE
jgi:hypothetical protein